jgi:DNA-binding response OmpR family regulator
MTGERMLLVENDEQIRKLLSVFLVRRGHEVEIVPNGEEALRSLRLSHPTSSLLTTAYRA